MNFSPLRYPGGKTRLTPIVEILIEKLKFRDVMYVEPFAGGSGVALSLLINGVAKKIVINDLDVAIYSFWRSILTETDVFVEKIKETPITIEEWKKQRKIYDENKNVYSFELGFATFFLNRSNRSGIIKAGPIGGYEQNGKYKIDARFNKDKLIEKIKKIAQYKDQIQVENLEIRQFLESNRASWTNNTFIYFDPPYVNKADGLYKNFLSKEDHGEIAEAIKLQNVYWMLTYDRDELIANLYADKPHRVIVLNHSAANKGRREEYLFLSKDCFPTEEELQEKKIKVKLMKGEDNYGNCE